MICALNWHFVVFFGQKRVFYLVVASLKYLLNGFNGMQHMLFLNLVTQK